MKISRDEFIRLALEQLDAIDRIARAIARDDSEADDLVQETFLQALRAHATFDLQSFGIKPWLLRILHNLHINQRKRDKRQPIGLLAEHLEAATPFADRASSVGLALFEFDFTLTHAINTLPDDLKRVVLLWGVEELSYKEIAGAMRIPIGTVMSRLHRARRRLRRVCAADDECIVA